MLSWLRIDARLWVFVSLIGLYTVLVMAFEEHVLHYDFQAPSGLQEPLGVVLGMLLVLRSNAAYNRWWEARTLWGRVVNECRNIALKASRMAAVPAAERDALLRVVVAFPYGLRDHLRDEARLQALPGFADATEAPAHVPSYLTSLLYERLNTWKRNGWIDPFDRLQVDPNASSWPDLYGACERIKNTPMVKAYQRYIRLGMIIYLLVLPWVVTDSPYLVVTMMVWTFFMAGIELTADRIESPFGRTTNDLQLDAICAGIERTVREIGRLPEEAASG